MNNQIIENTIGLNHPSVQEVLNLANRILDED